MIITCALSPSTSLTPSSVASPGGSALPAKPAEPIKFKLSDVKTEIDRVTDLKTSLENRINGQNNPLTEEDQKRLHDCNSKLSALETVSKLAEFAEQLDPAKNPSNNILNNLCTGLETFLGFNKDSKGYDGQGIVYSDLDRLCDGVMGFLKGVLGAVKNTQTYNVGKKHLNDNVVSLINKYLCSGHDGFTKLLPRLTNEIERYNTEVRQSNNRVRNVITTMTEKIEKRRIEVSRILTHNAAADTVDNVKSAETSVISELAEVKHYVEIFLTDMRNAEKHIADLNNHCRTNVNSALRIVTRESAIVHRVSDKEWKDLWTMEETIKNVLNNLGDDVKLAITSQITALVNDLIARVSYIKIHLIEINNHLWRSIRDLNEWIENNKKLMEPAITDVSSIVNKEVGLEYQEKIRTIAKQLKERSTVLRDYIEQMKTEIRDNVNAALTAVKNMDGKLKEDLLNVKKAIEGHVKEIKEAIGSLDLKIDPVGAPKRIIEGQGKIEDVVKYIKGRMDIIKEKVGSEKDVGRNRDDSIDRNWHELKQMLLGSVGSLTGERDGNSSLTQIVKGVSNYAKVFSEGEFEKVLTEWFGEIVDEGAVHGKIFVYVTENGRKLQGLAKKDKTANVKEAIKTALPGFINTEINLAAHDDIKKANVANIGTKLTQFADNIAGKLTGREFDGTIAVAIKAIESRVKSGDESHKPDLTEAIKAMLQSVAKRFKHVAAEVNRFVESSKIRNVNDAIDNVNDIGKQFDEEDDGDLDGTNVDYGYKMNEVLDKVKSVIKDLHYNLEGALSPGAVDTNTAASYVDSAISEMNTVAENHIGTTPLAGVGNSGNRISAFGTNGFTQYKLQVVPDSVSAAEGDPDKLEGTLPAAIKKIRENASVFNVNLTKSDLETWFNDLTFNLNSLLMTMSETADSIKWNLEHGNENVKIGLSKIRDNVHNLHKDFNNIIKTAESFITKEADEEKNKTIKTLTEFLSSQISSATATLTTAARRNYVTSVKQLLTAFADKVSEELARLPEEIDRDLTIGFKGLMRKVQGEFNGTETNENNINKLVNVKDAKDVNVLSTALLGFFGPLNDYLYVEIERLQKENNEKKHPISDAKDIYSDRLKAIYAAFGDLLQHITGQNRYDHQVPGKLDDLEAALSKLKPQSFEQGNTPILDGVTGGLGKFVDEMRKAYISMYDGAEAMKEWLKEDPAKKDAPTDNDPDAKKSLTTDGKNCAKVFLTCLHSLFNELYHVFHEGGNTWSKHKIDGTSDVDNRYELNAYLIDEGYEISNLRTSLTGMQIVGKLYNGFHRLGEFNIAPDKLGSVEEYATYFRKHDGPLSTLFTHLHEYYQVCHYATLYSTKQPTSVHAMLQWLSGLTYNPAHKELLFNGFGSLFEKKESKGTDGDGLIIEDDSSESLSAYPHDITVATLTGHLAEVCHNSHDVLTSILGHGHADGVYACDFNANPQGFSYPANSGQCIDMLVDVLCRLYQQLYFLYCQCCYDESCSGWRDCWYGNAIGGSSWKCNNIQCPDQKAKQTHRQKCNQNCDQTARCGIKSPLQSFLEDGLPGFLPHKFTKAGCKLECTMSNHRGIPCMTPMGFSDISITASHRQKGEHLKRVLEDLCGNANSPLSVLCSSFRCLMNTPPKNLGDIFAFYQSFLTNFTGGFYDIRDYKTHTHDAFNDAVTEAYFGNQYNGLVVSTLCSTKDHNHSQSNGDLVSITACKTGSNKPCGLYVQPLTLNTYSYYSSKHKTNHLSWIVYITETFYDLLKKLYDDCCGTCKKPGSRCYDKCCTDGCEVKAAYEAIESNSAEITAKKLDGKDHNKDCKPIVQCQNAHPNLYKYGFTFGNALGLSGTANNTATLRTCKDFCEALNKMLGEKSVLITLRKQIDEFLWQIRLNFSITVLALWLLSLLYLLHIMVIRLDLLHIKSHLHSPPSHRIAAQSLLASARVNKLNRVFYLQP